MKSLAILFLVCSFISIAVCLENGLARTPPMGWLSWERFKCNVRCETDPKNCISENLFMDMARVLVIDGFAAAGYKYVNIDDCWMAPRRDEKGDMVADPQRFPRGIKFLADFMHGLELKLGIYQDFGTHTCMGYPGLRYHMRQDAKKFAEWDIDMLKLDGCNSQLDELNWGYITMGQYLKAFKKPILYSCSWPYYQLIHNIQPNYELISSHCNLWRNYHDIQDSWEAIEKIIDFFGDNQEVISPYIGPGHWADPDMIMIGNDNLTPGQSRIQMAVWSMLPAPLLMSNDLRQIDSEAKDILLNKRVIAINQDPLGFPGKRIFKEKKVEIWKRKVSPTSGEHTAFALLFINKKKSKRAVIRFPISELLPVGDDFGYACEELFQDISVELLKGNRTFRLIMPPMDAALLHCRIIFTLV